jgi:hypothetical protein
MKEKFRERKIVQGSSAGEFTATEDGGMAKDYEKLIEIVTYDDRYENAYYFVDSEKADLFIAELDEKVTLPKQNLTKQERSLIESTLNSLESYIGIYWPGIEDSDKAVEQYKKALDRQLGIEGK